MYRSAVRLFFLRALKHCHGMKNALNYQETFNAALF